MILKEVIELFDLEFYKINDIYRCDEISISSFTSNLEIIINFDHTSEIHLVESIVFGNTVVSTILDERNGFKNYDEYKRRFQSGIIVLGEKYLNKTLINKILDIQNDPIKFCSNLLDTEKSLLSYIQNHFSDVLKKNEFSLISMGHFDSGLFEVCDLTLKYKRLNGTELFIRLSPITEDITLCLFYLDRVLKTKTIEVDIFGDPDKVVLENLANLIDYDKIRN